MDFSVFHRHASHLAGLGWQQTARISRELPRFVCRERLALHACMRYKNLV